MFSAAVSVGSRWKAWKTKPTLLRRNRVSWSSVSPVSSVPPMREEPDVTVSRPAMQCIRVDLPEPEGPMMAVNSPRPNATETLSSATTRVSPRP